MPKHAISEFGGGGSLPTLPLLTRMLWLILLRKSGSGSYTNSDCEELDAALLSAAAASWFWAPSGFYYWTNA